MSNPVASVSPIGTQFSLLLADDPDATAITCGAMSITRGELEKSTNQLARAYQELGVVQGDYVTIMLPNSIEWIQSAIAAWKLGAIPQPLSMKLPEKELVDLLDLVPRRLLVGRADPRNQSPYVPAGFTPDSDLSSESLPPSVSPALKAMASGGSTGRPKLIQTTDDGRFRPDFLADVFDVRHGETQLISVPLTHNVGFVFTVVGLLRNQHIVLMPKFEPQEFLDLISRHRVDYLVTVPTILQRALRHHEERPDTYDLSSIRRLWHVAAPCPPSVKFAWFELLSPEVICEMYGGTELQAMTTLNGMEWLAHRGSVGTPAFGEIKIFDEQGAECPPGAVGEIRLRRDDSGQPTYRYIGSTSNVVEGWDSLGDMGYFDEDGYLYLSDRRVDMFNVGGQKVYPAEIESALSAHPDVLSCLVVGVPHHDLDQVPYALVHKRPESDLDGEMVKGHVRKRLSIYKVPHVVEFVSEPLRDDAGKARRSSVRADVLARLSGDKLS